MPSTRDLRRRIKSVKNTSQITRAMQMVSATKMRKAQNQALSSRPYTKTLSNVLSSVSGKINPSSNPLLQANNSKKTAILLISTDKGLCGSLNTNLFRQVQTNDLFKDFEVTFYTIGKKGRDFLVRTKKNLEADFENLEKVEFVQAVKIRKFLVAAFLKEEIGQAYILYPDFVSTLRQEAKLAKILPIEEAGLKEALGKESEQVSSGNEFLFEPDPVSVLDFALTHFLDTQIYQALLETKASEHSARMIAMQNATDNAKELVGDLNLTYNQMRQDGITRELLEAASAGAALE